MALGISGRLNAYRRLLEKEMSHPGRKPLERLKALMAGHPSASIALLPPEVRRSGEYLRLSRFSRRVRFYNIRLFNTLHSKITQKLWLDAVMPTVAPPMTHYLVKDRFLPLSAIGPEIEIEALGAHIDTHGPLIGKPHDQGQGLDVTHLAFAKDTIYLNRKPVHEATFSAWLNQLPRGYTLSRVIAADHWTNHFATGSLNTLRIVTFTSQTSGRVTIMGAVLKLAVFASFPADNFNTGRGGLSVGIRLKEGVLMPGIGLDPATGHRIAYDAHPETGIPITGGHVPGWSAILETATMLAGLLPSGALVGWDIALSTSGMVVVEANPLPGLDSVQSSISLMDTPEKRQALAEMRLP